MQIDHYIYEYHKFHAAAGTDSSPDACLAKLYHECLEFIAAYESGDHDAIVSERLDVMNTAIFSTYMDDNADVLHFGNLKLMQTLKKYQNEDSVRETICNLHPHKAAIKVLQSAEVVIL